MLNKASTNLFLTENNAPCQVIVIKMDMREAVACQNIEIEKWIWLTLGNTNEVTNIIQCAAKRACNSYAASYILYLY